MKTVTWIDDNEFKRAALIRDTDDESDAPRIGVPIGPPDISHLDWDALARDLHNLLVDRNINSWSDVVAAQNGVSSAILSVFKRPIISLYREADKKMEEI